MKLACAQPGAPAERFVEIDWLAPPVAVDVAVGVWLGDALGVLVGVDVAVGVWVAVAGRVLVAVTVGEGVGDAVEVPVGGGAPPV